MVGIKFVVPVFCCCMLKLKKRSLKGAVVCVGCMSLVSYKLSGEVESGAPTCCMAKHFLAFFHFFMLKINYLIILIYSVRDIFVVI